MEIEFNTRNKADALKLSKTVLPNVLPHIIACLRLQFAQYRDHLCALIHFTVDCMTVQHVRGKEAPVIRIHQTSTIAPLKKKKKASKESLNTKSIYELSETVKDKAWKLELGLSSALTSPAGILSKLLHKISRGKSRTSRVLSPTFLQRSSRTPGKGHRSHTVKQPALVDRR